MKDDKERLFADDPFWKIDDLIPKKSKNARAPLRKEEKPAPAGATVPKGSSSPKPGTPLFTPPYEFSSDAEERKNGFPLHPFAAEPDIRRTYETGVIKETAIYAWPNKYAFFAGFRKNAIAILHMEGKEAPYTEFFSFMPQFHQMNAAQVRYYLYWRTRFFAEEYLRVDFCYLLLYIYEVINLPDLLDKKESADRLCRLWLAYRDRYSKLDKYLGEWLCDYCLVNGVMPNSTLFEAIAPYGYKNCTFKEFYITPDQCALPGLLGSEYNYKASKYRTKKNAEVFDRSILGAMEAFFKVYEKTDPRFKIEKQEDARLSRMSYDGAVCVYSEKKRIDLTYTPVGRIPTSIFVTDAVKYCENCVRAALGIRARFPTPSLDGRLRAPIEDWFSENLPSPGLIKKSEERRINNRYEQESRGFSSEEARKIEESSLSVAEKLGKVYEEDILPEESFQAAPAPTSETYGKEYAQALRALRQEGASGFAAYAGSIGVLPHTLAEEINEEALERFGDVILVGGDDGFELLADYENEVEEWIRTEN